MIYKKLFYLLCLLLPLFSYEIGFKDQKNASYREFLDGADALQWGNSWSNGSIFSKEEQEIIYQYSRSSAIFNTKLREGASFEELSEEAKKKILSLDKALNKFIIFENILVYRYEKINLLEKLYPKETVDKIYNQGQFQSNAQKYLQDIPTRLYMDRGFMSTTLVRNAVFTHRPIELVIKVEKYSDALFIARRGFSFFIQEYELLFPRNRILIFEKFEISEDKKKMVLYARMRGPYWLVKE